MIFLSYSRADSLQLADRIAARLIRSGHEVWLDRQQIKIGEGWSQSVESAVDSCTQMIALLTPGSYQSPICRGEQLRALRQKKPVLPLRAGAADLPVYLEGANYLPFSLDPADSELNQLIQEIGVEQRAATLKQGYSRTPYQTAPVPEIRPLLREEQTSQVRDYLLQETESRVVAIVGMGGLGKTVLARQLIDDQVIQAAFHDGLLWATFGREVDEEVQLEQLQEFAKALEDDTARYTSLRGAMNQLRTTLKNKSALLILDDVWERKDIEEFIVDATRCRILMTTRRADVADAVEATRYELPSLTPEQSIQLIALKCSRKVKELPAEATEIVKLSDGLPMTLALVGSSLRKHADEEESWAKWREVLARGDWSEVEEENPQRKNSRVLDVLQTSWELLSSEERETFLDLAVFPKKTGITRAAIEALSGRSASQVMRRWVNLSLVRQIKKDEIGLHSIQADFVYDRRKNCSELHQRLAQGMADRLSKDPEAFFADAYLPHWYAFHLRRAGRHQEAEALLQDPEWLKNKLRKRDIASLLRDFAGATEEFTRTVGSAVAGSSHVLRERPDQLASQLLGRLRGVRTPGIERFLELLATGEGGDWLEPLTPSLTEPGSPLLRILPGSSAEIRSLAISSQGTVVAGCDDGMIRTWSLAEGTPINQIRGHFHSVQGIAASPNGRHCATVSEGGSIRVWRMDQLGQLARFNLPSDWSCSVLTFAGDNTLAVSGDDGMLRVFDAESLTLRYAIDNQGFRVRCVCSMGSDRIASGSSDNKIRIWDVARRELVKTLPGHSDTVRAIHALSDTLLISGSDDRKVIVWDVDQGGIRQIFSGPETEIVGCGADLTRKLAFGASADGVVWVWDLATNLELRQFRAHSDKNMIYCTDYDTRSGQLLTGSSDRTIRAWGICTTTEAVPGVEHENPVYAVDISADGQIAVSGGDDARVRIWRIEGNSVAPGPILTGHTGEIRGISISDEGDRVATGSMDSSVRVWDRQSGKEIACLRDVVGKVKAVTFLPRSESLLAGGTQDVLVHWKPDTNEVTRLEGHSSDIEAIAVDGSGTLAVSGSVDHTVRFWDLTAGALIFSGTEHADVVREVAITENGEWAVSGSEEGQLLVWDVRSRCSCRRLEGHTAGITALAVTPDGRIAVSGGLDRTIRVWDLGTSTQRAEFEVGGAVHSCAISRDGNTIIAGDDLGHVHFLKLRRGKSHGAAA